MSSPGLRSRRELAQPSEAAKQLDACQYNEARATIGRALELVARQVRRRRRAAERGHLGGLAIDLLREPPVDHHDLAELGDQHQSSSRPQSACATWACAGWQVVSAAALTFLPSRKAAGRDSSPFLTNTWLRAGHPQPTIVASRHCDSSSGAAKPWRASTA